MNHDWEVVENEMTPLLKKRGDALIHCKKCLINLVIGHSCDLLSDQLKRANAVDCHDVVLREVMGS